MRSLVYQSALHKDASQYFIHRYSLTESRNPDFSARAINVSAGRVFGRFEGPAYRFGVVACQRTSGPNFLAAGHVPERRVLVDLLCQQSTSTILVLDSTAGNI